MMRKLFGSPAAVNRVATAFLRFLPLLFFLLFGSAVLADDLSTLEEGFVCESTQVRVSTTCASDPEAPFDLRCAEQHFVFADANGKIKAKLPASGQVKEKVAFDGRKMGQWLDALATHGACLKGRDGSSVVIGYIVTSLPSSVYGWEEIYDLKGHMLASSRVPEQAAREDRDRIKRAYDTTYQAMGLPELPGNFHWFRDFKDPLRLPKPASSEDWSHIRRYKPVGYELRYMNVHNEVVRDTVDIEKVDDRKIKFLIDTMDERDHVCRLAWEAIATNDDPRDFVFAHGKKCQLRLNVDCQHF